MPTSSSKIAWARRRSRAMTRLLDQRARRMRASKSHGFRRRKTASTRLRSSSSPAKSRTCPRSVAGAGANRISPSSEQHQRRSRPPAFPRASRCRTGSSACRSSAVHGQVGMRNCFAGREREAVQAVHRRERRSAPDDPPARRLGRTRPPARRRRRPRARRCRARRTRRRPRAAGGRRARPAPRRRASRSRSRTTARVRRAADVCSAAKRGRRLAVGGGRDEREEGRRLGRRRASARDARRAAARRGRRRRTVAAGRAGRRQRRQLPARHQRAGRRTRSRQRHDRPASMFTQPPAGPLSRIVARRPLGAPVTGLATEPSPARRGGRTRGDRRAHSRRRTRTVRSSREAGVADVGRDGAR